jgi:hypothetical protein
MKSYGMSLILVNWGCTANLAFSLRRATDLESDIPIYVFLIAAATFLPPKRFQQGLSNSRA